MSDQPAPHVAAADPLPPHASDMPLAPGSAVAASVRAFATLGQAHWQLLRAESREARRATRWILPLGLAAGALAVAWLAMSLVLVAWLLAEWLQSWPLALAALVLGLTAALLVVVTALRRRLRALTLPASRQQWRESVHQLSAALAGSRGKGAHAPRPGPH